VNPSNPADHRDRLKYLPTNDLVFRRMVTDPNHPEVPAGLITDFFNYPVEASDIRILPSESIDIATMKAMTFEEKRRYVETRRDVTLEIASAKVTVEMQILKHESFVKRSLFYSAHLYTENYDATPGVRDSYRLLKPVWALNILDHGMFADDRAFHMFALLDEKTGIAIPGNLLRIGFFEIPKQLLISPETDGNRLAANRLAWAHFFHTGIAPADAPAYIKAAAEMVAYVNHDPKEVEMIDAHQAWIADYNSALVTAQHDGLREGIQIGKHEGILEGRLEVARNMLANGIAPETAARLANIDLTDLFQP